MGVSPCSALRLHGPSTQVAWKVRSLPINLGAAPRERRMAGEEWAYRWVFHDQNMGLYWKKRVNTGTSKFVLEHMVLP